MTTAEFAERSLSDRLLGIIKTQTEIAKLGLDLGGVMSLVCERAATLTMADGAVVELAEGDDMVYRAASGIAEGQLGLRLNRKHSLSGLCVELGQALQCDNSENDPRVDRDACRRVGLLSMLVVPLQHHDTVVGAIEVISQRANAFDDADVVILELMSELIAAAMFHATHYQANELFQRATQDSLTGIANRALFFDRLRHSLPQAERNAQRVGVLYLDIDGLKKINDEYGHRAGDAAIKALAVRLTHGLRQSDTAARLGGDEFGLIVTRLTDRSAVLLVIKRLLARINDPFVFEDRELPLAVSVGLALYPDDGDEIEVLLEKADQSMYADKRSRHLSPDVTCTPELSQTHSFPAPKMFVNNPVELLDR